MKICRKLHCLADDFGSECRTELKEGMAFRALLHQYLVTGATMAFRSRLRHLVLPIPGHTILQHDAWIALIIAAAAPVVFLDEPLIKYRQHYSQQIGASVKGSKYKQRSSPLIDEVSSEPYPAGEIHAFKTVYARLITKSEVLGNGDAKAIQDWILRLEREQAVRLNQTAPANKQKPWQEMKQHLDSRTIRIKFTKRCACLSIHLGIGNYLWRAVAGL
jgi:hypothetical protein